jgi:PadR family transcriptional regulator AphA
MEQMQPSLTEYAVLGLLAEGPTHGFAISKELEPDGAVGRILTVRQPLVYRALGRLVNAGLAESVSVEPGDAGPQRVVHRITSRGRRHLMSWLSQPVEHVRDLRIEFLLKLVLLHRSGTSPVALVAGQRATLHETLTALENPAGETTDPIELWRKHNAAAVAAYLVNLEDLYRRT